MSSAKKKPESMTECESIVMKCIWDAGKDISLIGIMELIENKYKKAWKRQTVSTFLLHLIQKGYVSSYRLGRVFYYHEEIGLEEYKETITSEFLDFWFDGSGEELSRMVEKILGSSER